MDKKILIITNHRAGRSPGQRFRFEQYLDFLSANGIDFEWDILLSKEDDILFYSNKTIKKLFLIIKLFFIRIQTVRKANRYDAVLIFREAFVIGGAFFEKWIAKRNPNIIFDFDDAIWLKNVSEQNKKFEWLKNPEKTKDILALSKVIISGNSFLDQYARKFNPNTFIIPTTIDTDYHIQTNKQKKNKIIIGWTGTSTTLPFLEEILPELEQLKAIYNDKIDFKIIVDVDKYYPSINTYTSLWSLEDEILELSNMDIGIMPLPNTEWAKGKCGFKGLQYMALEIPTIMSPVGVNSEIIKDGENGFLASNKEEWIIRLSELIESKELRFKLGKEGRNTVVDKYSIIANKKKYLTIFLNSI